MKIDIYTYILYILKLLFFFIIYDFSIFKKY